MLRLYTAADLPAASLVAQLPALRHTADAIRLAISPSSFDA